MNIERLSEYVAELLLRTPRLKFVCLAPKSRKGPWVLAKLITGKDLVHGPFVRYWIFEMKPRRVLVSFTKYWHPISVEHDPGEWQVGGRTLHILRSEYAKFKDWPKRYAKEGLPMTEMIEKRVYFLKKFLLEYDRDCDIEEWEKNHKE